PRQPRNHHQERGPNRGRCRGRRAAARRGIGRGKGGEQITKGFVNEHVSVPHAEARNRHRRPQWSPCTTRPFLITVRIVSAPTLIKSIAGPLTTTASSCLPGSRLPTRSWRSSAYAALIVAPTSASSNVSLMPKQTST